jgi:RimJ/RimL family protein N-acetyltransferase
VRLIQNEAIIGFLETKLGTKFCPPFEAFGFVSDDDRPMCAFVFNDNPGSNIEMSVFAEPGGMTRGVLRYIANYAFNTNKCRRLTVRTRKRNKRVLKLAPRYGFTYESVMKHYYGDDDAVVFRMLREDCRYL